MTQENANNQRNPMSPTRARTIASQAAAVVYNLITEHRKKKHIGYKLYEDDRIRIGLDTYAPNEEIDIKIPAGADGKWTTVFSTTRHSPDNPNIFRPGRWTDYLAQLYPRALEVQTKRQAEIGRKQAEDRARRYEPVDDAAVYTDIPAATGRS